MKRNVLLAICILIVFGFAQIGCSVENDAKGYSYEIYIMSDSTLLEMDTNYIGGYSNKDAIEYVKSQLGTSLIDKGKGLTIDDVRNLLLNQGLSDDTVNSSISIIENSYYYRYTRMISSIEYRVIFIENE
jgi:hypothetical protein